MNMFVDPICVDSSRLKIGTALSEAMYNVAAISISRAKTDTNAIFGLSALSAICVALYIAERRLG